MTLTLIPSQFLDNGWAFARPWHEVKDLDFAVAFPSSDERLKSKTSLFSRMCCGFQPRELGNDWKCGRYAKKEYVNAHRGRDCMTFHSHLQFAIRGCNTSIYSIDVCFKFCVYGCICFKIFDHLLHYWWHTLMHIHLCWHVHGFLYRASDILCKCTWHYGKLPNICLRDIWNQRSTWVDVLSMWTRHVEKCQNQNHKLWLIM